MARVMFVGGTEDDARRIWNESNCGEEHVFAGVKVFDDQSGMKATVAAIEEIAPDVVVVDFQLSPTVLSPHLILAVRTRKIFAGVFIMKGGSGLNLRESLQKSAEARERDSRFHFGHRRPSSFRGIDDTFGDYSYRHRWGF